MGDASLMSANDPSQVQRREFLQAGALASAAAVTLGSPSLGDEPKASKTTLPTRKLGKTGVDVTILNQGTWRAPGALDRILRFSYANGVRYFDTAKSYGSEPGIAKWMQAMPEVRKNIFLVTKDSPRDPSQMMGMLDQRLASLKTDYVDLFFIHALGDHHGADEAIAMRQEPGAQGGDRGDQEVGQGEVRRLLDPPQEPRPDHPGGGRGRVRRRDHGPVHRLARQGHPAQQGARRRPQARGSA